MPTRWEHPIPAGKLSPPSPIPQALLPRVGYLYSLVPLCLPRFSRYLKPGDKTPWFEYRNLPLKWCAASAGAPGQPHACGQAPGLRASQSLLRVFTLGFVALNCTR